MLTCRGHAGRSIIPYSEPQCQTIVCARCRRSPRRREPAWPRHCRPCCAMAAEPASDPGQAALPDAAGLRVPRQQVAVAEAVAITAARTHRLARGRHRRRQDLAYLVPALSTCRAAQGGGSTHTINLQEQLIDKDVPRCVALPDLRFRVVVLKGMSNHLPAEPDATARSNCWKRTTTSACAFGRPRPAPVMSPSWTSPCPAGTRCAPPPNRAGAASALTTAASSTRRGAAAAADLVIVNHALLQ